MKRILSIFLAFLIMASLTGCGNNPNIEDTSSAEKENVTPEPSAIIATTTAPEPESTPEPEQIIEHNYFKFTVEDFISSFNSHNNSSQIKTTWGYTINSIGGLEIIVWFLKDNEQVYEGEFDTVIVKTSDTVTPSKEDSTLYMVIMLLGYNFAKELDADFTDSAYSKNAASTKDGYEAEVNGIFYEYSSVYGAPFDIPKRTYSFECRANN